ncbi:MAG: diacylglycerol kinase family protein [Bacteroidota bacterium]
MQKKALFIINPTSGTQRKEPLITLIHEYAENMDYGVVLTESHDHATELAQQAVRSEVDYVIAVGGDGTVNEVASVLYNTQTALGIIPIGSGNGLARHLGISTKPVDALKRILNGQVRQIDTALVNGKPFFCTSGTGADAHVSQLFKEATSRGFWSYLKISARELFTYLPQEYEIEIDGDVFRREALLVTAANATQFGNNAHIAPTATDDDGKLDICLLKSHSRIFYPFTALRLFRKSLDKSKYWEMKRAEKATIRRPNANFIHLDGDPVEAPEVLEYEVIPKSLSVIV